MTEKALFCIPVYHAVVVALALQLIVGIIYGSVSFWWLSKSDDDEIEILKQLVGCSLALAVWVLYGAFVASVGLYGMLRRKRFMKNFVGVEAFVWVCHIGICIWYLVVYYNFRNDEGVRECEEKMEDGTGGDDDELCEHLLGFRTVPLAFVWLSFILEALIQTALIYFLFQYRLVLISYKMIDPTESLPLTEVENQAPTSAGTQRARLSETSLAETGQLLENEVRSGVP